VTSYRESAHVDGVTIRTTRSTFMIRLRANLRALRPRLPWLGLLAVTPAGLVLLASRAFQLDDADISVASWAWGALVAGSVVIGAVVALSVILRSIRRPAAEGDLPREMTFQEDTIVVRDANDVVFDAGWSWLAAASATPTEIVLTIRREPLRLIFVKREILTPKQCDDLHRWLTKNGKLG
jgi:hypothetical protein